MAHTAELSVIVGLQGVNVSLGEVESWGVVKLVLIWSLHLMIPSIQGLSSGFKGCEDPKLEVNSLKMEPCYVQAQLHLRDNEQSRSPTSAKASRLTCEKKSQEPSQLLSLSLSICVSSTQDVCLSILL